jgi:RNA polymerase sigma factor (sigma-70 family)
MVTLTDRGREERLALALNRRLAAAQDCGDPVKARRHERRAGVLTERLLMRLRPVVRRLAQQMAGYVRRAGQDAQDLEQEAFLCLLKAMRSYDPARGHSLRAFVLRVLANRFIGFGRRRAPEAIADLDPAMAHRQAEDARRQVLRREVADLLGAVLPDDAQQALKVCLFHRYHFEGWTLQELADSCGLAVTTVHRYLGQARESFRTTYLSGELA